MFQHVHADHQIGDAVLVRKQSAARDAAQMQVQVPVDGGDHTESLNHHRNIHRDYAAARENDLGENMHIDLHVHAVLQPVDRFQVLIHIQPDIEFGDVA